MKSIRFALVILAACSLLTGCAGMGDMSYTRPFGDGKATVAVTNGEYSVRYRPTKNDGKALAPPVVTSPPPSVLPSWLSWLSFTNPARK
jgi:hypothetical protein